MMNVTAPAPDTRHKNSSALKLKGNITRGKSPIVSVYQTTHHDSIHVDSMTKSTKATKQMAQGSLTTHNISPIAGHRKQSVPAAMNQTMPFKTNEPSTLGDHHDSILPMVNRQH